MERLLDFEEFKLHFTFHFKFDGKGLGILNE